MTRSKFGLVAVCLLVAVIVALPSAGLAQTAGMLSFQGRLKDAGGQPVTGTVVLEFRIWDAEPSGTGNLVDMDGDGTPEDCADACTCAPGCTGCAGTDVSRVTISNVAGGLISTKFGPVHPTAFDGNPRWLEVTVLCPDPAPPLPRLELARAPAAAEQLNVPGTGTGAALVNADGSIGIRNGAQETITLDGKGVANGGHFLLSNSAGIATINMEADVGVPGTAAPEIHLVDPASGPSSTLELGAAAGNPSRGGQVILRSSQGPNLELYARAPNSGEAGGYMVVSRGAGALGRVLVGAGWDGTNTDPWVRVHNDAGALTLALHGGSVGGQVTVRNAAGGTSISLVGATGMICAAEFSTTGGCDVAESFNLTDIDAIMPGMVLVMDAARPGHLTLSTRPYDKKVAGIVSGAGGLRPGVLLGGAASEPRDLSRAESPRKNVAARSAEQPRDVNVAARSAKKPHTMNGAAQTDLPIALSGRVYCYVDATQNAVEIGDLLTTSETPGYAMKVTDFARSQGAVLGKAMEPLARGEKGLVLVLVALQ